jgi:DNA repair photolyase
MNVQITHYTKSEKVEIKYSGDSTYYIHDSECGKLTKKLLHIMNNQRTIKGYNVEIITKEYI